MKKDELAKQYIQKISESPKKNITTKQILAEIDQLVYSDTKKSIYLNDKRWILEYIYTNLPLNINSADEIQYIEKSSDNKYYLSLIHNALEKLNEGK